MQKACRHQGTEKKTEAQYLSSGEEEFLSPYSNPGINQNPHIFCSASFSLLERESKASNSTMKSASSVKILLIEDSLAEAIFLQELLKDSNFQPFSLVHVKRLGEALNQLHDHVFDVALLDLTLPDSQGLESVERLIEKFPSLPIVVLTNTNDDELAIMAVRQGAEDYLVKREVDGNILVRSLKYAIERKHNLESLKAMNQSLEMRVQERTNELIKAQEQNQLRSEFVSMISHDIRNPLNTILASAVLLQDYEQKLSQEKKVTLFQRIRSASKNMAQLLDEVLLIGQADYGQLQYQPSLINLEVFCRQLVDEIQLGYAGKSQINLNFKLTIKEVMIDSNLLRRILINLLENAIKYSPKSESVQFDVIVQDQMISFCIQDQGIGIPADSLPVIFEPFHRAKNVGSISGTGLGLAIVKHCVDAHGGKIWVDSQMGIGTTFIVRLPLVKEDENG
ncbi:Two-component hybrid sensor and regulator [Planktothrix sp. PCC 11201]|uniref:hybrid sensor histidine kinase/response regulator n=1 Tax=Planktothrix sp. PCC 11201 TaxID=1729650 RepID=UPI00091F3F8D|nr:hybrid sensor histidine kinase/response regulator [Planktothrix sp. PCC 11201]SKB11317.1 Two-component hybrid sensor and regulator [Planktothrix sp. PCC 11201]